ncbi:MAG: hypothetical protein KDJ37_10070 [Hyphomicrobiaceae bacterium]|nr:hypothetical protein [Hyphomicrobiaceae bacterium]
MPFDAPPAKPGTGSSPRLPERSLSVFLVSFVLFFPPFLGIFDRGATTTVAGIPLLFVYLFGAWALVIALMAMIMESRAQPSEEDDDEEHAAPGQPADAQHSLPADQQTR